MGTFYVFKYSILILYNQDQPHIIKFRLLFFLFKVYISATDNIHLSIESIFWKLNLIKPKSLLHILLFLLRNFDCLFNMRFINATGSISVFLQYLLY